MAANAGRLLWVPCRPRLRLVRPIAGHRAFPMGRAASTSSNPSFSAPIHASHGDQCSSDTRSFSTTSAAQSAPGSGKFNYHVAASYIAKGHKYVPSTHVFHFNPYNRVQPPKPGKSKSSRPESGQDAFFVSRLGTNPHEVALGVADGVGGWMDSGVDPADFSHAFCDYMAVTAHGFRPKATSEAAGNTATLTARELMQSGYSAVCHDPSIKAGGSTAIVALLAEDGTLEVANLGDSGYILLRLNGVHAASEPQTHAFNTPYQLSVVPPSMLLRAAAFGGAQLMDQPRDAEVTRLGLRHGDVLIFASDGLWDNLFNQDILRVVSKTMKNVGAWASTEAGVQVSSDLTKYTKLPAASGQSAVTLQSLIATEIVGAAKSASLNRKLDGPFAKEVSKYYPHEKWHGGKEDDICAVVVVVSEEAEAAAPKAKL
ncbi:phosphatase 2C-like domain-containing protein [Podospora aff. communis PSN243]|uniref:Protein phosphatase n=1 Tax=Podospora aff. communis PSN243 TaxID=3040156 RepID=A0AAV9GI06_9PEZI|nr:phosphatase 2C-like domain-containing protein [Podospora aff. communis PSN243]